MAGTKFMERIQTSHFQIGRLHHRAKVTTPLIRGMLSSLGLSLSLASTLRLVLLLLHSSDFLSSSPVLSSLWSRLLFGCFCGSGKE
jgi:hypothetical protein